MFTTNKIESETSTYYVENGVLFATYKEGVDVKLKHVEANFLLRKEIQQDKKMLVFADVQEVWQISDRARAFAAKKQVSDLTKAMAVITGYSIPIRLLGNFFIKFEKPAYPTKLFKSKEKALAWLDTFR